MVTEVHVGLGGSLGKWGWFLYNCGMQRIAWGSVALLVLVLAGCKVEFKGPECNLVSDCANGVECKDNECAMVVVPAGNFWTACNTAVDNECYESESHN